MVIMDIEADGRGRRSRRDVDQHWFKIDDGRDFGFTSLSPESWVHSWILHFSMAGGQFLNEDRFLKNWNVYQNFLSDLNVAELLGLSTTSNLSKLPSWCISHPWAMVGPRQMKRWLPPRILRARRQQNVRSPFWARGSRVMDLEVVESGGRNFEQFRSLLQSISQNGFNFEANAQDPMKVDVLVDGSDTVWSLHSGFHRTALLSTLGYNDVLATQRLVVRREEVESWPQVLSGDFSQGEALAVFDSFFEARLLPWRRELQSRLRD